jgi:hypothetical protein
MSNVVTPADVEARLRQLGRELDFAHEALVEAEHVYFNAKGDYEIAIAAARIREGAKFADKGLKVTVQEREDMALMATTTQLKALYTAEAVVRAVRGNVSRLKTQIDIARSVGTSVRTAMELT